MARVRTIDCPDVESLCFRIDDFPVFIRMEVLYMAPNCNKLSKKILIGNWSSDICKPKSVGLSTPNGWSCVWYDSHITDLPILQKTIHQWHFTYWDQITGARSWKN
jgi:hypothetical protein